MAFERQANPIPVKTSLCAVSALLVVLFFSSTVYGSIDQDEAVRILCEDVLLVTPHDEVVASMLKTKVGGGDFITSEGDDASVTPPDSAWLAFVDDDPCAMYGHAVRYVLIDHITGSVDVTNAEWPCLINGTSYWDLGDLVVIYPLFSRPDPIVTSTGGGEPDGDYGDAPDNTVDTLEAYPGVLGQFPTLYGTGNSDLSLPGCHVLFAGGEMLGNALSCTVSIESDADDFVDPDGVPNLVDADSDERIFLILDGDTAQLALNVCVDAGSPAVTRYLNVLVDFDRNGYWDGNVSGTEWALVNMPVSVLPGNSETIISDTFQWGEGSGLPTSAWMRILLSRTTVSEATWLPEGGWDGSGAFSYGEVSDYLAILADCPELSDGGGGGDPQNPGPALGPCGYEINYHALIINGGDTRKHIVAGCPIVQNSVDAMAAAAAAQGYDAQPTIDLPSSANALTAIENAVNGLKPSIQCGDRVLVYICAHGPSHPDSLQVQVYTPSGAKKGRIKAEDLSNAIDLSACPNMPCTTTTVCCHVTIILESCYAGKNFKNVLPREGRTVIGTSDNTVSRAASCAEAGVYTQGFIEATKNPAADTNGDGGVEPSEAYVGGSSEVLDNNSKYSVKQQPWIEADPCTCMLPTTYVGIVSFEASPDGECIRLEWETAVEIDNAGFNIYRGLDRDGSRALLNSEKIPAKGDELLGGTYSLLDCHVERGRTYFYWLEDIDVNGTGMMHGPLSASVSWTRIPKRFKLAQNDPNPFSPITEIRYDLPKPCHVRLEIYDVTGRRAITLLDGHREAGTHSAMWNGKDENGFQLSGGVYFYRLEAGGFTEHRKMVMLR
jgi:hypothetical protein